MHDFQLDLSFKVRLTKGTFYNAILHCKKDNEGRYKIPEYEFFNQFFSIMTGKETNDSDSNHRTKIKYLKNCQKNTFKDEIGLTRIDGRLRDNFDEMHSSMRAFIKNHCNKDRIDLVVAMLLSLVALDESIEGKAFISSVNFDGSFVYVSKNDILEESCIDYAILFLSLFEYSCRVDNKIGEETILNWDKFVSSEKVINCSREIKDSEDKVLCRRNMPVANRTEQKEINPELLKSDRDALSRQIDDNPDLARLVNDIDRHWNIYVETEVYRKALKRIAKLDYLMISGAPGSGKTCTSEMIALKMAGLGYRVEYLYGFRGIKGLYDCLTKEKNKEKTFILLDDCMGQAYYELEKQHGASDLLDLVSFVKRNKKHIKLLMNSRVNIICTAMNQVIGESILSDMEATGRFITAGELSRMEKAKILLRHVVARSDKRHYQDIGWVEKRCLKIVDHKPFLPRVIDHVTRNYGSMAMRKDGDFFKQIISALDNPADVWKKIYEDNKATPQSARILLEALFTLTNSRCDKEKCREVFNHIATTNNPYADCDSLWYEALEILNESMITQSISLDASTISFYDPSVHDYLENSVFKGKTSRDRLLKDIVYYTQIEKVFRQSEPEARGNYLKKLAVDGDISRLKFDDEEKKNLTIITFACCCVSLREEYKPIFSGFFANKPLTSSFEWKLGGFRDFRLGVASCLLFLPELRSYYIGEKMNLDKFNYLTENITVREACKFLPYVFRAEDALSFVFDDKKMREFMHDAVSNTFSNYGDYIDEIEIPKYSDEIEDANDSLNEKIYESCREYIDRSDLSENICSIFEEVLDGYGHDDYSDVFMDLISEQDDYDDDEDLHMIWSQNNYEDSDDAILGLFFKPFDYYKEKED